MLLRVVCPTGELPVDGHLVRLVEEKLFSLVLAEMKGQNYPEDTGGVVQILWVTIGRITVGIVEETRTLMWSILTTSVVESLR